MINAKFFTEGDMLCGFQVTGHSGSAVKGEDIICAAVSSAAYMTANTITDIIKLKADISVDDGYLELVIKGDFHQAQRILEGFRLHLESLADDYPKNLKVTSIRRCQDA